MSARTGIGPDEPEDVAQMLAGLERDLAGQRDVDGYTERVQAWEAEVAEADRLRDLPTAAVLAREQQLAEAWALAALETDAHASGLRAKGERERASLQARASSAAARREMEANVDVQALKLGHQRRTRASMLWTVLLLAMAFTAVNVQRFAAGGAAMWSPQWWVAWGVDPLLSGLVIALLLARGDLAGQRRGAESRWDRRVVPAVELGALGAVLLMNVAPEIRPGAAWESVALHIVVPLAAMAAALALPVVQRRYAAAITDLYQGHSPTGPTPGPTAPEYRHNDLPTAGPTGLGVGPTGPGVGDLVARARDLIRTGDLDPNPSATRLRDALRCGTTTARQVRDTLNTQ